MHDQNSSFLLRTTNVKKKFHHKDFCNSTHISWEELQSLNAGEWFLEVSAVHWYLLVHTPCYKGSCVIMQHAAVTGSIIWLSRQILSIQCPSCHKRRRKQPGIRLYPAYLSSSTLPSSTTSQWYLTYIVTGKMTQRTQLKPSWSLGLTKVW